MCVKIIKPVRLREHCLWNHLRMLFYTTNYRQSIFESSFLIYFVRLVLPLMLLLDDLEACLPQRATLLSENFGTTVWSPGKASALADVLEMLDLTFTSPCSHIAHLYKFSQGEGNNFWTNWKTWQSWLVCKTNKKQVRETPRETDSPKSLLLRRSSTTLSPWSHISNSDWQHEAVSEEGPKQVICEHCPRSCGSASGWWCSQGRRPLVGVVHHLLRDDSCPYATWHKINTTHAQPKVLLSCNSHLIFP